MAHVEDRWKRDGRHGTGRRWRVRYAGPDGRERSKSFDRKVDAERFRVQVEADVQRGTYIDPAAGKVTLRRYAQDWLAGYHPDSSRAEHIRSQLANHVYPVLGDLPLGQIAARPSLIQAWLTGLPLAPSGAEQVLITVSSLLGSAVADGLIQRNPCKAGNVRAPKVPPRKVVPWTAAQIAAVRAGMPDRWKAALDCGAGLGLRQGEIFGLQKGAVDFLRQTVHVRTQVKRIGNRAWLSAPKGGRQRDVPLPQAVSLALAAHIAEHPPVTVKLPWNEPGSRRHGELVPAELVFSSRQHGAITAATFYTTAWRPARTAARLGPGGLHALRHFYASALLAGGVDVRALSEYLGHHDPAVTLRVYAHLMPSAEGRALRAIEAALSEADGPDTAQAGENPC